MARQNVMDQTGHTTYDFDPNKSDEVASAMARFNELVGKGFAAAKRVEDGTCKLMREFDPTADETVFFPQLKGG
jgi:hypothetical protein